MYYLVVQYLHEAISQSVKRLTVFLTEQNIAKDRFVLIFVSFLLSDHPVPSTKYLINSRSLIVNAGFFPACEFKKKGIR